VTHNYVDIMSRIYVDSTPAGTGSKCAEGAQGRNSGITGERLPRLVVSPQRSGLGIGQGRFGGLTAEQS
jgi:hypothetical protein